MTADEWLTCDDPTELLKAVWDTASERQFRLFLVACCRHFSDLFADDRFQTAIDFGERYADGHGHEDVREVVHQEALEAAEELAIGDDGSDHLLAPAVLVGKEITFDIAESYARRIAEGASFAGDETFDGMETEMLAELADILKDIVPNPGWPVVIDPAWRTGTVVGLAEAIYHGRAFDRMPVLADALEEAGCSDFDLLHHCRHGEHHRGCFVVDAILGRG